MFDCLVIGGGPAGLTAAIYLARYHLSVKVVDDGNSRANLIPLSRNHAGFPHGISGSDLLKRMRDQAAPYGVRHQEGKILELGRYNGTFTSRTQSREIHSATVLLATGVVNRQPDMPQSLHDEALQRGLVRYCPICDGYEVTDQPIAVLGTGLQAANEAEFIRSYSADVTVISPQAPDGFDAAQRQRLEGIGVRMLSGPCLAFELTPGHIDIRLTSGTYSYAALYPALGSDVHSEIGISAGARVSSDRCVIVDRHQSTNIDGLFAAGDVVLGLDQISNAMGQGGVAATAIRNYIAKRRSLLRQANPTENSDKA